MWPSKPGSTNPAVEWMSRPKRPSEELCVGTHDRPARYMPWGASTSMQRTGTLAIGRTSTIERARCVSPVTF